MKNNRGITLTSVIIYVIGLIVVVGTISTITTYFYKNIKVDEINDDSNTQYTQFSSVFLKEINKEGNYVVEANTEKDENNNITSSYIIFGTGNQYTFLSSNHSIYKNKVKICENIENCEFSSSLADAQYSITVNLKTNSIDLTGDNAITYTLKQS